MYTHIVKYWHVVCFGARVESSYKTTSDAVELHRERCEERLKAGEILSFEIVEI